MSVLHVTSAREWRGGENQLALLLRHLPAEWRGGLAAPGGSPLAARVADILPVVAVRSAGFADLKSVLALRRLIGSGRFRLVHAHTSPAHAAALLARLGTGLPLVVSRRNAYPGTGGWKYRAVDRFVTISQAGKKMLEAAGVAGGRIEVIHDMVEPPTGAPVASAPLVVCIAAMTAEKDHETLLRAWARVEPAMPDAALRLVGEGPLRTALEERASRLGLRRVTFAGAASAEAELARARVAVLTSREEGLGSAICLAQAMRLPAVVTDAGGLPEAVSAGRTGLVVPVGDDAAVAAALLRLLRDDALHAKLSAAAAARAATLFDPRRNAAAHVALYEEVLAGR